MAVRKKTTCLRTAGRRMGIRNSQKYGVKKCPGTLPEIEGPAYKAKCGSSLKSSGRYDPYEFSCVIEDAGDGIALITNASGAIPTAYRNDFWHKLKAMGFSMVRWVRVVERALGD